MVPLFTKPVETLDANDLAALMGWPESQTVEYKRSVPARDGRPCRWLSGAIVDENARDKIFKEVIALANTVGGHVILGIAETGASPPRAESIHPIPQCAALAERLEQAAQSIDPPIPLLLIKAVCTEADAGIVIFRVPQSRSAPHRGLDKECYIRRGTSSVPVGMREIQDMTIASDRRGNLVEAVLLNASTEFERWSDGIERDEDPPCTLLRISAFPAAARFEMPPLDHAQILAATRDNRGLAIGPHVVGINAIHMPHRHRPILRGLRFAATEGGGAAYMAVTRDGLVSLGLADRPSPGAIAIAIEWIMAHAINVLATANMLRSWAGQPDAEYVIETEISAHDPIRHEVRLHALGQFRGNFYDDGSHLPLKFPRLIFGPANQIDSTLDALFEDVLNAAGRARNPLDTIRLAR